MNDAKELKELLGNRAKNIIIQGYNMQVKAGKVLCPLHDDTNPSMSWHGEANHFHCFACNGTIDIYDYFQERENLTFVEAKEQVAELVGGGYVSKPIKANKERFIKPELATTGLSDKFKDYLHLRKLNDATIADFKLVQGNYNNNQVYVFQYFDENNDLPYISFRGYGKGGQKGGCIPNTKSILYGMWLVDKDKPLVITEGQFDAMAIYQAGYKNVVSVPAGANNLNWINYCWEWLQDIPEFIVFADNDDVGLEMAKKIKRKLTNVKIIFDYGYQDPNHLLYAGKEQTILDLIDEAINSTPDGLNDLSQIEYKSYKDRLENGIETGFKDYDAYVEDWKLQEITIITGRNNEGKSTLISQIIAHCLEKNVKTFLYSGEMSENKIQNWLYRQMIGGNRKYIQSIETKYGTKVEPRPDTIKAIKNWHRGKLFLYDRKAREVLNKLDHFFMVLELAVKRFDVKLILIDNLMAILEEQETINHDQSNFVQRCKDFAIDHHCHVVLITHPNKIGMEEVRNAEYGNLRKMDISGTSNISNKADNIMAIERDWGEDRSHDAFITSLKDREVGQRRVFKYDFDRESLRFYNDKTPKTYRYSWEREVEKAREKEYDKNAPF